MITSTEYIFQQSEFNKWLKELTQNEAFHLKEMLIEFTKLHVTEALKTALEEVPYGGSDSITYEDVKGILTCYPETNIK